MEITTQSFETAFKRSITSIWDRPDYITDSRIGVMREIQGFSYTVEDPESYKFTNEYVGRIDYQYAETFYDWMMSGSTDIKAISDEYPTTAKFLDKPKSENLPDNFNTFYGPRIIAQLPYIIKELTDSPNSRRAVLSILSAPDLELLDKDETLEFPCCDSAAFSIRNGRLNSHVHMRSQNMGQVLKLDMYLWGRFQCELAKKLQVSVGTFTSTIVSAHVFARDEEYLRGLNIIV